MLHVAGFSKGLAVLGGQRMVVLCYVNDLLITGESDEDRNDDLIALLCGGYTDVAENMQLYLRVVP